VIPSDIRQQLIRAYLALDEQGQKLLLVNIGHWLTVVGRDTYDAKGDVEDGPRLRAVNEALHKIVGQLRQMISADDRRYPDTVFANIVIDQFELLRLDPAKLFEFFEAKN
jgi:hypothetical protein